MGGDHHHRRGGDSGGGDGGGASGAGVTWVAAEGEILVQQPGQFAAAMAEEGREMRFSVGRLVNLPPLVFVLEYGRPQRGCRGSRQEMSRAMAGGASGPKALTLLLRLLMTHSDGVDTEEGYTKLHTLGMCNSTPSCGFSREFRVLVSTATGSERALFLGPDVVLEVVRVAAN